MPMVIFVIRGQTNDQDIYVWLDEEALLIILAAR